MNEFEQTSDRIYGGRCVGLRVGYQMLYVHEGTRDIADFVIREGVGHLATDLKSA